MNVQQISIETTSLKAALAEASSLGFTTAETAIGTHRPIDEWLEELDESGDCTDGYALFRNIIVRITDAWQRDAEVIHLD